VESAIIRFLRLLIELLRVGALPVPSCEPVPVLLLVVVVVAAAAAMGDPGADRLSFATTDGPLLLLLLTLLLLLFVGALLYAANRDRVTLLRSRCCLARSSDIWEFALLLLLLLLLLFALPLFTVTLALVPTLVVEVAVAVVRRLPVEFTEQLSPEVPSRLELALMAWLA